MHKQHLTTGMLNLSSKQTAEQVGVLVYQKSIRLVTEKLGL